MFGLRIGKLGRISKSGISSHDVIKTFCDNLLNVGISASPEEVKDMYKAIPSDIRNNAATVLLPVSGKEGVIYGFNTENGDLVPFDFARATQGTFFDTNMTLQIANANVPRIDNANYNKDRKILLEKSSTNLVVATPSTLEQVALSNVTDPFYPAKLIKPNATNIVHRVIWATSVNPGANTQCASVLFKSITPTALPACMVRIRAQGDGTSNWIIVNLVDKQVAQTQGAISATTLDLGNGWFKMDLKITATMANSLIYFIINPSPYYQVMSNSVAFSVPEPNDVIFACPQTEVNNKSTSYIVPTSSATTRAEDNLSINLAEASVLHVRTLESDMVVNANAGVFNIHELINNGGITYLTIAK